MMADAQVTVSGWIGTQPRISVSESGIEYTNFRLAANKRYFSSTLNEWVTGPTTWYTVKCWRGTARNVADSLRKSDGVLVTGTLSLETWDGPEGPRTSAVISAIALGPDLSKGTATFRHTERRREAIAQPDAPIDVSGMVEVEDDEAPFPEDSLTMEQEIETREQVTA